MEQQLKSLSTYFRKLAKSHRLAQPVSIYKTKDAVGCIQDALEGGESKVWET